jgi:hypothetical protein
MAVGRVGVYRSSSGMAWEWRRLGRDFRARNCRERPVLKVAPLSVKRRLSEFSALELHRDVL